MQNSSWKFSRMKRAYCFPRSASCVPAGSRVYSGAGHEIFVDRLALYYSRRPEGLGTRSSTNGKDLGKWILPSGRYGESKSHRVFLAARTNCSFGESRQPQRRGLRRERMGTVCDAPKVISQRCRERTAESERLGAPGEATLPTQHTFHQGLYLLRGRARYYGRRQNLAAVHLAQLCRQVIANGETESVPRVQEI